jgi:hypothetical protein
MAGAARARSCERGLRMLLPLAVCCPLILGGCATWKDRLVQDLNTNQQVMQLCATKREEVRQATDPMLLLAGVAGFASPNFCVGKQECLAPKRLQEIDDQLRKALIIVDKEFGPHQAVQLDLLVKEQKLRNAKLAAYYRDYRSEFTGEFARARLELRQRLKGTQAKAGELRRVARSALQEARQSFASGACSVSGNCPAVWTEAVEQFIATTQPAYDEVIEQLEATYSALSEFMAQAQGLAELSQALIVEFRAEAAAGGADLKDVLASLQMDLQVLESHQRDALDHVKSAASDLKVLSEGTRSILDREMYESFVKPYLIAQAKVQLGKYFVRGIDRALDSAEKMADKVDEKAWFAGTLVFVQSEPYVSSKVQRLACEFRKGSTLVEAVAGDAIVLASCESLEQDLLKPDSRRASVLSGPVLRGMILGTDDESCKRIEANQSVSVGDQFKKASEAASKTATALANQVAEANLSVARLQRGTLDKLDAKFSRTPVPTLGVSRVGQSNEERPQFLVVPDSSMTQFAAKRIVSADQAQAIKNILDSGGGVTAPRPSTSKELEAKDKQSRARERPSEDKTVVALPRPRQESFEDLLKNRSIARPDVRHVMSEVLGSGR